MNVAEIIRDQFPEINEPALVAELEERGRFMEVQQGEHLIDIGGYVKFMPLVLTGAIKVMREDENGDEIFLYYLLPGQTCAMTLNCCMANNPSEISAVAVEDTTCLAIPVELMDSWLRKHRSWQNFVLNTYGMRFQELLSTIDSIAFLQLDERLLNYLKEKSAVANTKVLETTHQQIAYDLHSSREVISRLLKQLEKRGLIELQRNKVILQE